VYKICDASLRKYGLPMTIMMIMRYFIFGVIFTVEHTWPIVLYTLSTHVLYDL